MRYVLRIRVAGFGNVTLTSILEHFRYSGDTLYDWKRRDDGTVELLLDSNSWGHERQIERAKSFGFEYVKAPYQKITSLGEESFFQSLATKVREK